MSDGVSPELATIITLAKTLQQAGVSAMDDFTRMVLAGVGDDGPRSAEALGIDRESAGVALRTPTDAELAAGKLLAMVHAFARDELADDEGENLMLLVGTLAARFSEFSYLRDEARRK